MEPFNNPVGEVRVAGGRRRRCDANGVTPGVGARPAIGRVRNGEACIIDPVVRIEMPHVVRRGKGPISKAPGIMGAGSVCRRIKMDAVGIVRIRVIGEMRIAGGRRRRGDDNR